MTKKRALTHAKRAYYCTCGKIVHGNGGKTAHFKMHKRRADGHRRLTQSQYEERFNR